MITQDIWLYIKLNEKPITVKLIDEFLQWESYTFYYQVEYQTTTNDMQCKHKTPECSTKYGHRPL